jgi:lipid-A-disaccharide synthase
MSKRICIIAGEPSGDFLGAKLAHALLEQDADISLSGVGGPQMKEAGVHSLFPYEELAVMGIAEVVPKIPRLLSLIRQTVNHIKETKPDIVVTIDSPDFSFRVARSVKKKMGAEAPKLVHYVAPTVWAWREGRAEKIAQFLDGLICLFDFEPPYFEKVGLKAVAVGHPMVEGAALQASGERFRDECGIAQSERVVGVLFGSRHGELSRTGPVLSDALLWMCEKMGAPPHVVAPTLPHLERRVFDLLRDYPGPRHIITDPAEKWDAFKAMDIAIATSGTVGLELAMLGVPHVIAYKASPLTAAIARKLVKVKYAHLANIMADKAIVPEFLQEDCTAEAVADKAFELWSHPSAQKTDMAGIAERLGAGQEKTPSQKAAAFVNSYL